MPTARNPGILPAWINPPVCLPRGKPRTVHFEVDKEPCPAPPPPGTWAWLYGAGRAHFFDSQGRSICSLMQATADQQLQPVALGAVRCRKCVQAVER